MQTQVGSSFFTDAPGKTIACLRSYDSGDAQGRADGGREVKSSYGTLAGVRRGRYKPKNTPYVGH